MSSVANQCVVSAGYITLSVVLGTLSRLQPALSCFSGWSFPPFQRALGLPQTGHRFVIFIFGKYLAFEYFICPLWAILTLILSWIRKDSEPENNIHAQLTRHCRLGSVLPLIRADNGIRQPKNRSSQLWSLLLLYWIKIIDQLSKIKFLYCFLQCICFSFSRKYKNRCKHSGSNPMAFLSNTIRSDSHQ